MLFFRDFRGLVLNEYSVFFCSDAISFEGIHIERHVEL